MIWAILAALGVPLWLCAIGIVYLVFQNRKLRKRPGNIPVRVNRPGKKRWTRGHANWVSDVFAWRGSPAAWNEDLLQAIGVTLRDQDADEEGKLHGLGDDPVVATLTLAESGTLQVAGASDQRSALLGPFESATVRP